MSRAIFWTVGWPFWLCWHIMRLTFIACVLLLMFPVLIVAFFARH
jgi:hypothetical protein